MDLWLEVNGVRRQNGGERGGGCGGGANTSSGIGEQRRDDGSQLGGVSGIETPRDSGCAD